MIRSVFLMGCGACMAIALSTPGFADTKASDASAYEDVERFEDGDAKTGAKLYKRYCRGCHGEDGRGGAHTFMPHIENLTKKGYIELLPDSYLYLVIAEGGEAVGKNAYMPAWNVKFSDQEIKDVIAHLRAMPTF
ncbi:MAG: c-type cytochrome [Geminicoccaceae bacterium]